MAQFDALFETTATDPVCGMEVEKANPPGGSFAHEGETYYFCAPGCRTAFSQDPARYLANPGAHGHGHHHE